MTSPTSRSRWKLDLLDTARQQFRGTNGDRVLWAAPSLGPYMKCTIYCLVDGSGQVHVKDDALSHAEVAAECGLEARACEAYRFDLSARRALVDRGSPESDRVAHEYWDLLSGPRLPPGVRGRVKHAVPESPAPNRGLDALIG